MFTINLTGTGVQPGLNFSFVRRDFGPCFLYRAGMPLKRTTLIIRNEDTKDIRLAVKLFHVNHFIVLLGRCVGKLAVLMV